MSQRIHNTGWRILGIVIFFAIGFIVTSRNAQLLNHSTTDSLSADLVSRLVKSGQLDQAEELCEKLLKENIDDHRASQLLISIYQYQGRNWEAKKVALDLLSRSIVDKEILRAASGIDHVGSAADLELEEPLKIKSSEQAFLLHQTRSFISVNTLEFAEDYLQKVISLEPTLGEAQGRYGQILAEQKSPQFRTWHQALPESIEEHPEIWMARGMGSESIDSTASASCYVNVLRLHPFHERATQRLEALFAEHEVDRKKAPHTFGQLGRLNDLIRQLRFMNDSDAYLRISDDMKALGRDQEAIGWRLLAENPNSERLLHLPDHAPPVTPDPLATFASEVFQVDPNHTIDWNQLFEQLDESTSASEQPTHLAFTDVAKAVGIDFQYDNGSLPENDLGHIIETLGGGVAVLDYDLDGWSDVFLPQGGEWRDRESTALGRLFQNVEGQRFAGRTDASRTTGQSFAHGATSGDFNSDGFPDFYVCSLYENRLYLNNGDGTFSDVTDPSGTDGDEWSVSAGFADLNADGLSDLYVVNYLDRDQVLTTVCEHDGRPRTCPPTKFAGAPDKCYLNLGDGRFREISRIANLAGEGAKGLGLLIGDFDQSGQHSIFVSNDTTHNFLFKRPEASESSIPQFEEIGLQFGVATDTAGRSQASMGIAAGDANNDGEFDLFVTNFYGEANNLFLQTEVGFVDRSTEMKLDDPGFQQLGFGTQFLDADLDSDLDLFVANGHIDRTFATGEPDVMRPQMFENLGGEFFKEVVPDGEFFREKAIGRAVATLDWNRDGRVDVAVTHIDRPFALIENESTMAGNRIALKLVGKEHERDAIGASVFVKTGDRSQIHCITAGHGYACHNERKLIIGLGDAQMIDEVSVRWINGRRDSFREVPVNKDYLCIEGRGELIRLVTR